MKNKLLILLSLSFLLTSCGNNNTSSSLIESSSNKETSSDIVISSSEDKTSEDISTSIVEEIAKYVVTWKNYDGTILEIDENVIENSMPHYDGNNPVKEKDDTNIYIFDGWDPELSPVICDITYTAKFKVKPISEIKEGIDPVISKDGKTVKYGFYPQSHINDETLITNLNKLTSINEYGYYEFEGNQYAKQVANTYNGESYSFMDNTPIINNESYWFKVETITWNILSNKDGTYYLLANSLLDEGIYYSNLENRINGETTIYPNNYNESDINKFLNQEFFNKAFIDNSYIKVNENNKVFLPTLNDYLNTNYGFSDDISILDDAKKAKVSDYALCRGAWKNIKDSGSIGCGTYWTSTACEETTYTAYNINSGGFVSNYAVDGNGHCIRPAIKISF